MYWTIATAEVGEEVVFLDTFTSYKQGIIRKIKGSCPAGESGNILIETKDGVQQWVLGSNILESVEAAEKQIAYNLKHPGATRKL